MTHDQYIASDPAISAWVSASAGTGKTKVLTDRVLRLLLLPDAAPSKILCITYTKAASAEMQQRIEGQLGAWAIAGEKELRESLTTLMGSAPDTETLLRARRIFARVLSAPDRIRIQTIHGFCQSVLIRFPLEADIAPHFTLIDEQTSRELLQEARMRLFTESRGRSNPACAKAIEALAVLMSETSLNELIESIIVMRRKFAPWFSEAQQINVLYERIYEALKLKRSDTVETLLRAHFNYTREEEDGLRQACKVLSQLGGKSDKTTFTALEVWLHEKKNFTDYSAAFLTKDNKPRAQLCTKDAEKLWSGIQTVLATEQARVVAFMRQYLSLKIAEASTHLMTFAQTLLKLYTHSKQLRGYMDYDDLIWHTVRLFHRKGVASWVLYKLDGGIDHLLVDEAQDTSPEQWQLVEALANEFFAGEGARSTTRTLFVVGDEKQSIFSFQGAAPVTFDTMQKKLSKRAKAAGMKFERVRLALSFRSTAPVLQAVDTVFRQPTAREGLVFSESDISHDVNRKDAAGRVELWPLCEAPAEDALPSWHVAQKASYAQKPEVMCAKQVADSIAAFLKDKKMLASQGRAVEPGDIMILVQRRGAFADAMLRALKQKNIPVAGADRLVLTQHIAVMDCIALAEFLLLPQDDLMLAALLKSPFIGLSEEALFELAHNRGNGLLWQRLRSNPKYQAAADFLSELLSKTDYLPPYELFAYALETSGARKKLTERLGSEVDDPLNEFLSLALQYTRSHPPALQGFLQWLSSGATEIKRDMEKGRNEVRIMTVHGAKGLQAPVVFLPDTTRSPRYDTDILWTQDNVPLWSPLSEYNDEHYTALKSTDRMESDQEYRRLLYVAMTRAEDELYICGWKSSKPFSPTCWYELIRQGIEADTVAWESKDNKRILSSPQRADAKIKERFAKTDVSVALPSWAGVAPADEPTPPKPLAPSRIAAEARGMLSPAKDPIARERGLLIHRLLQYLPEVAEKDRATIIAQFIGRYGKSFTVAQQEKLIEEVLGVISHSDFAPVFGVGSVAEAPISGIVASADGSSFVISGQIDRLAVIGNDVYIIDYKTNREVPQNEAEIPRAYLRQMEAYRQLVSRVYPDKTIHLALLWTAGPRLMILSHAILESLAA